MQPPAKPIIEPTDKSNSPAIINIPAPSATIPNWDITLKLFLMPRALKPSPENGLRENWPSGIEKYPRRQNNINRTLIGPTSGLANIALYHFFSSCRSDSFLDDCIIFEFIFIF